jgi:hypothetical protein
MKTWRWLPQEIEHLRSRYDQFYEITGGKETSYLHAEVIANEIGCTRHQVMTKIHNMRRKGQLRRPIHTRCVRHDVECYDDGRFAEAMMIAITAGLENAPVGVCKMPGTRFPVVMG